MNCFEETKKHAELLRMLSSMTGCVIVVEVQEKPETVELTKEHGDIIFATLDMLESSEYGQLMINIECDYRGDESPTPLRRDVKEHVINSGYIAIVKAKLALEGVFAFAYGTDDVVELTCFEEAIELITDDCYHIIRNEVNK